MSQTVTTIRTTVIGATDLVGENSNLASVLAGIAAECQESFGANQRLVSLTVEASDVQGFSGGDGVGQVEIEMKTRLL